MYSKRDRNEESSHIQGKTVAKLHGILHIT